MRGRHVVLRILACAGVRDVLLKTSDPYTLLFNELPSVMGIEPTVKTSSDALRACLFVLRQAYPALLDEIEQSLRGCFDLHGNFQEVASSLRKRAAVLHRYATDPF